jgi:uncharacterized phiE125 gp8 family phage protein
MGLALVTGPTVEPLTLEEAKAHLRVDSADEDALIAGYILAARKYVETQTGPLVTQTWDYTVDRAWPMVGNYYGIRLPYAPCQSVTSVSYVDADGATQTLDSGQYQASLDSPIPCIWQAYGASWPSVRDQPAAITVRAVYGYGSAIGSVPDPIRQAILLMVGRYYEHREEVVLNMLPYQVQLGVEALIGPYAIGQRSW